MVMDEGLFLKEGLYLIQIYSFYNISKKLSLISHNNIIRLLLDMNLIVIEYKFKLDIY